MEHDQPTESLWVRIKKTGKGDIVVGVCYKPLNQEEQADEVLYRQLFTFTGPGPTGELQPPHHLLEGQHSRA